MQNKDWWEGEFDALAWPKNESGEIDPHERDRQMKAFISEIVDKAYHNGVKWLASLSYENKTLKQKKLQEEYKKLDSLLTKMKENIGKLV